MKRYGITITEIIDIENNSKVWPLRPKHFEEKIFEQIIPEKDFNIKFILQAILTGMEGGTDATKKF